MHLKLVTCKIDSIEHDATNNPKPKPSLGVNAPSHTVSTTNSILIQETIVLNIVVHTNLYRIVQTDGSGVTQKFSLPKNISDLNLYNFVDVNFSNSNKLDTIFRLTECLFYPSPD